MRKFLFLKDSEWTLLWLNKIPRIPVIHPVIMRKPTKDKAKTFLIVQQNNRNNLVLDS